MAGKVGKSGRKKKIRRLYRFAYSYREGVDPPELGLTLESIMAAKGEKRQDILRAVLLGGSKQAEQIAAVIEDAETSAVIDDIFADF